MRIPKKEVRINGFQFRRLFIRDALETEFRGSCNIRLFGWNCSGRSLFGHDAHARSSFFMDGRFLCRIRGLVCRGCLSCLAKSQTFERLPVLFRNCGRHEGESSRLAPSGRAVHRERFHLGKPPCASCFWDYKVRLLHHIYFRRRLCPQFRYGLAARDGTERNRPLAASCTHQRSYSDYRCPGFR